MGRGDSLANCSPPSPLAGGRDEFRVRDRDRRRATAPAARGRSACEMPRFSKICCTCQRTVFSERPVAAAISRTVLPSASSTATRLSAGVRPRAAATESWIDGFRLPVDYQDERGDAPGAEVDLASADGIDVHRESGADARGGGSGANRPHPARPEWAARAPALPGERRRRRAAGHGDSGPVEERIALPEDFSRAFVRRDDPPATVEMDDPQAARLQQAGEGQSPAPWHRRAPAGQVCIGENGAAATELPRSDRTTSRPHRRDRPNSRRCAIRPARPCARGRRSWSRLIGKSSLYVADVFNSSSV